LGLGHGSLNGSDPEIWRSPPHGLDDDRRHSHYDSALDSVDVAARLACNLGERLGRLLLLGAAVDRIWISRLGLCPPSYWSRADGRFVECDADHRLVRRLVANRRGTDLGPACRGDMRFVRCFYRSFL